MHELGRNTGISGLDRVTNREEGQHQPKRHGWMGSDINDPIEVVGGGVK